jgi:predicted acyltransferase
MQDNAAAHGNVLHDHSVYTFVNFISGTQWKEKCTGWFYVIVGFSVAFSNRKQQNKTAYGIWKVWFRKLQRRQIKRFKLYFHIQKKSFIYYLQFEN